MFPRRSLLSCLLFISTLAYAAEPVIYPNPTLAIDSNSEELKRSESDIQLRRKIWEKLARDYTAAYKKDFEKLNPGVQFPIKADDLDPIYEFLRTQATDIMIPPQTALDKYREMLNGLVDRELGTVGKVEGTPSEPQNSAQALGLNASAKRSDSWLPTRRFDFLLIAAILAQFFMTFRNKRKE